MLRDGAGCSSDTRYALMLCVPAQARGRSPDSRMSSPHHKKAGATTGARLDVEARPGGMARRLDTDDNMDDNDNDKRQRLDILNQLDDMYAYLSGIPALPDDVPQQMISCFANGRYHNEFYVAVLAAVLDGFYITKMFSPERVTKLCKRYHLDPGDSFYLRTGYDLSDDSAQNLVMNKIDQCRPALVIGSPPYTMLSRLQQFSIRGHGDT